jgi:hypothetical protein
MQKDIREQRELTPFAGVCDKSGVITPKRSYIQP